MLITYMYCIYIICLIIYIYSSVKLYVMDSK